MVQKDDDAWRAIVDNYGERPDLENQAGSEANAAPRAPEPDDLPGPGRPPADQPGWDDLFPDPDWDEDRFVPPTPPPIPSTTADRLAAWLGIFGSPAILLICLVLGIRPPEIINYLLVIGFVGGFVYLVVKMNREPRDPDDNGAVL